MSAKKILIADDDEDLVSILKDFLESKGYETFEAYEGIAVFEVAKNNKPDLILLDWKMPAGKGSAALEMLAEKEETRNIPVIVLSGASEPGMFETVRKMGVKSFIKKPYESEKLLEEIDLVLNSGNPVN